MFTLAFWRDAFERAVRTAAQTFAALYVIGAGGVVPGFDQAAHDGIVAGVAAGLTIVMALAGGAVGNPNTASYLPATAPKLPPPIEGLVSWLEIAVVATLVLVVLIFVGVTA